MIYNVIERKAAKFDWGDETAIGDADWWAGLKRWITTNASADDRAACVGKKKLVSLSTAVLGANAATMVCIGADQDGDNTLAFQTLGVLPNTLTFDIYGRVAWIGSNVRSECENFYNYGSAKNAIKIVNKGTCPNYSSSRNASVTYSDETVFLLSEREMGLNKYSSLSTNNSTTTKAECTYGYNASYSYYTSSAQRLKYVMDANGILTSTTSNYYERSRCYNVTNAVCHIWMDGTADYAVSSSALYRLAPAFVIG